jgi:DNA transposition AAA+ family ATPase
LAEHLRLINSEAPPEGGWFAMTETARDMLRTLDYVRGLHGGGMTMIAAAPGTGKTATVQRYIQANRKTVRVEAVSGEGGIWSAAIGIFKALDLGDPNSRDLPGDREKIAEAIGVDGMLIIDEAQYLTPFKKRWMPFKFASASRVGCDHVNCSTLATAVLSKYGAVYPDG